MATNGNDLIVGKGGGDIINARGGDDLIDPSRWTKGRFDLVKGGKGRDTFIVGDGYWVQITDFNIKKDTIDLRGLNEGWYWEYFRHQQSTHIFNFEGNDTARIRGFVDLDNANIIWD